MTEVEKKDEFAEMAAEAEVFWNSGNKVAEFLGKRDFILTFAERFACVITDHCNAAIERLLASEEIENESGYAKVKSIREYRDLTIDAPYYKSAQAKMIGLIKELEK